MTHRILMLASMVLTCTSAVALAAQPPVAVTTCGQVISGQAGFLTADLDCTAFGGNALVVIDGSLDLRGFTLTGGDLNGVRCESKCTVFSSPAGGTITGASYNGVNVGDYDVPYTLAYLSDIVITANGSLPHYQLGAYGPDAGIIVWGKAVLTNVVVSNTVGDGISGSAVVLNNSQVVNNDGNGVEGVSLNAVGSTISGNGGSGVWAESVTLDTTLVENNSADYPYQNGSTGPDGVIAFRKLKMSNTTVRNNHNHGIRLSRAKAVVEGSTIANNGASGIYLPGGKLKIVESQVDQNQIGIHADPGKMKVEATSVTNNQIGIYARGRSKVIVAESNISANASYGVRALDYNKDVAKVSAKASHFGDNGLFDISSQQRPKFTYVAGVNDCVQSERNLPGTQPHWGICSLDCTNGDLNPGETCDTGGESASCDDDCTVPACGDANLNETVAEECDDGGTTPGDGCDAACIEEFCGDSITQPGIGEACDDGAVFTASCDNDCTAPVCGDGVRNPKAGEQCDDDNANNGDGCSSTCKKE